MMGITDYLMIAHFADALWSSQIGGSGTSPTRLWKIRVMPVVGRIGKLFAEFIGDFLQIGRKLAVGNSILMAIG